MRRKKKELINNSGFPEEMIEQVARALLPDLIAFYESEEGQREFAEWKMEQAKQTGQDDEPPDAA